MPRRSAPGSGHAELGRTVLWFSKTPKPYIDLTANGGPAFDATSPVTVDGSTPSGTGVGHFFWTAYTPNYYAEPGCMISRTWLATAGGTPPVSFPSAGSTDATAALGLVPPVDTVVDKRGRNADGSLNGQPLGGYRVTWFNPTVDPNGDPVPPDFWVVELTANANVVHFMLPSSYPALLANPGQAASSLVLTDCRTYLPSGNPPTTGPQMSGGVVVDTVGPGYCWFDVPLELRPAVGSSAVLTVFGIKSIQVNNPPKQGGVSLSRVLNRTDWVDGIKTATAQMSVIPGSGVDLSYAHKIPFNYPWDIVVVNGPATYVAP